MDRHVDLSTLPEPVADAITALVNASSNRLDGLSREHLGDLVQAAEAVKGFADAVSLDATHALVEDVIADHGVPADDARYAERLRAHRRQAGHAVVHEVQLLTGSTLPAARDRVRFATALCARTSGARHRLRAGECSWERARVAFVETAHLDPALAGEVIDRLLAPPKRTRADGGGDAGVPLSHNGFRARIRRQLALVESAAADAKRRHADAVARRDAVTFPGRHGTATLQVDGDTTRICAHPAIGCDLDHDTPHTPGATEPAQGATHPANLHAVHRGHHNTKTGRFWISAQHPDATITWATLTRHVTTTAYNHHRDTDHAPPNPSRVERVIGQRVARVYENDLIPSIFKDLTDHQLAATPTQSLGPPPF